MHRYDHGGDRFKYKGICLDFSVNLNPLGMPRQVKDAIVSHADAFEAYPDIYCHELCCAIAKHDGVRPENVLCGNGATELIYRICLVRKPRTTLLPAPTFSEYERAALLYGSRIRYHHLSSADQFALTGRILSDITPDIDLFFLCNPNNPTGQLADASLIEAIAARCDETDTLLVADECFLALTEGISCKPLLGKYKNLMVLDAFTKRYAMAGLRLGYVLSDDTRLIEALRTAGPCWNVSSVAQAAGIAALSCTEYEQQTRALLRAERFYLAGALEKLGLHVYPGQANYILFTCDTALEDALLSKGILIRSCANFEGLDQQFYRVCVMQHQQNLELIAALKEVLHG